MKINKFQDLEIWQISIDLVLVIYTFTKREKFSRDFGLIDQIRRATVSCASNIAEGFEISNNNDFIRFLRITKGSIGEVKTQLYIAYKLGYVSEKEYNDVTVTLDSLSVKVGKFISYLIGKRNNKEFKTR
jgi:four helix bundle protein